MSGSALFHIAFIAVVVLILLTVWAATVLEAGEDPPGRQPDRGPAPVSDRPGGSP
jgi:hypothetical protein